MEESLSSILEIEPSSQNDMTRFNPYEGHQMYNINRIKHFTPNVNPVPVSEIWFIPHNVLWQVYVWSLICPKRNKMRGFSTNAVVELYFSLQYCIAHVQYRQWLYCCLIRSCTIPILISWGRLCVQSGNCWQYGYCSWALLSEFVS